MAHEERQDNRHTLVAERVAYWMPILEVAFNKRFSQDRHDVFYTVLLDLPVEAVNQAFLRVLKERKTFPPPAVVRDFALEEARRESRPQQRELFLVVDNSTGGTGG